MDNSAENKMDSADKNIFEKSFKQSDEALFYEDDANILNSTKHFSTLCKSVNQILQVNTILEYKKAIEKETIHTLFLGKVITIHSDENESSNIEFIKSLLKTSIHTPIFFWTGKKSIGLLTRYFMSVLANLPLHQLNLVSITDSDKKVLLKLEETVDDYDIFINENKFLNIDSFKQECEKMIEQKGVQIIVTDALELLQLQATEKSTETTTGLMNESLQNFAKEKNICIINFKHLKSLIMSIVVLYMISVFASAVLVCNVYLVFKMTTE